MRRDVQAGELFTELRGTAGYRAPELCPIVSGHDEKVAMWALGVVIHVCATGM